ncbi:MAG: universal stress protein [Salegentibacter sp.]
MKNILLPTDFTDCSLNAIKYAFDLFRGQACNFYLLSIHKAWDYATEDLMAASAEESVYDSVLKDNRQKLDELIDELKKGIGDQAYVLKPVTGYDVFTDAINQAVELNEIDLIVMGTDGATGPKEIIFGSHSIRVIRKVNCPLLVIPLNSSFLKLEKVLLALSAEKIFQSTAADALLDLGGSRHPSVEVIRMLSEEKMESETGEENEIRTAFRDCKVDIHPISGVPFTEAVNSSVQVMNVDLLLLPVKREEFLERLMFGSEVSRIIYTTKVPILIVHEVE